jgi:hypothetical protein
METCIELPAREAVGFEVDDRRETLALRQSAGIWDRPREGQLLVHMPHCAVHGDHESLNN